LRPYYAPGRASLPSLDRYRPKKRGSGLGIVVLLLIVVAVVAVVFRRELTSAYDQLSAKWFGTAQEPKPVEEDIVRKAQPRVRPVPMHPDPDREPKPVPKLPDYEVPKFEPRTLPAVPKEEEPLPVITPKEHRPGLAYSTLERKDIGVEGVSQVEVKVVVPKTYKKDDLLRVALDIVAGERRQGTRHAVRLLCFTDSQKTSEDDAFAEVDWAPGGDFFKAGDAVRAGPDNNEYKVHMKKP
jgi:hypothetical protein